MWSVPQILKIMRIIRFNVELLRMENIPELILTNFIKKAVNGTLMLIFCVYFFIYIILS